MAKSLHSVQHTEVIKNKWGKKLEECCFKICSELLTLKSMTVIIFLLQICQSEYAEMSMIKVNVTEEADSFVRNGTRVPFL